MDMDERWVNRSPEVMLETFHWFRGECFGQIVEDLLSFPAGPGVIVEGFRLLPHVVGPLLTRPEQAVWLLPAPAFRVAAFGSRGSLRAIAGQTGNPDKALANLLERDRLFTERLEREAIDLGLRVIEVGVQLTEDALAGQVAEALEI